MELFFFIKMNYSHIYLILKQKKELNKYLIRQIIAMIRANAKHAIGYCERGWLPELKCIINEIVDEHIVCHAADHGRYEVVKFLIENNVNINANSNCATRIACKNGNIEMLKLLIAHGGNPFDSYNDGLIGALKNKHYEIIEFIENYYNINLNFK